MPSQEPSISIILLNWNGKKDTLECLASLEKLDYPFYEIIVVDNGSTDDSVAAIRHAYPHITLIETGKNLGFAGGNNVGIRYALKKGSAFIFLLNNDTVVDPQLLRALVKKALENPSLGVIGPHLYLYTHKNQFDHLGGVWNRRKAAFDFVALREIDTEQSFPPLDYVCGCAFFVRREVFEKIGLLEERFFLVWEEADFCFRAKKAGFHLGIASEGKVWHKVSASFVGGKPHLTYFWWRGRLLWIERNCSWKEKLFAYFCVLIPELAHLLKLKVLKTVQLLFPTNREARLTKIRQYNAALCGVRDYLLKRGGRGPSWIYNKKKG